GSARRVSNEPRAAAPFGSRVAERERSRVPEVESVPAVDRACERLALLLDERAGPALALVGPPRQALPLLVRSAPEKPGPLEVAAGKRELREAGERVQRPETILLRALHLEGAAAEREHQELVPLSRLPPRPAFQARHLGSASCELDRPVEVAVVEGEL